MAFTETHWFPMHPFIFWKTRTFFKKLEYCFLVEVTKSESASFPYKTVISEANVKTIKW